MWGHQLDLALANCNRVTKLDPNQDLRVTRGHIYLRTGNTQPAISEATKELVLHPNEAAGLYVSGKIRGR